MSKTFTRTFGAIAAIAATIAPVAAASAQGYQGYDAPPPPPPPSSAQGYDAPGYQSAAPERGYDGAPPRDVRGQQDWSAYANTAPHGYDGSQPPPPPPGYQASANDAAQRAADQRYEAYAEDWSQRYCVKSGGNAGAGAVIGGLFGALLGSSIGGRGNHTAGALIGGAAGAVGGAAVGDASGRATSPGCPPGYVVRRDAPQFYYEGYGDPYYYAAPGWYQPWIFVGGRWSYRPYPYHNYYYRSWGYGRPGGYYGRPGYRGGWHGRRW